jgi:hypothetical protein
MNVNDADLNAVILAVAARLQQAPATIQRSYYFDPFFFEVDFTGAANQVPASGTIAQNFLVQNDSAFAIVKSTYFVTDTSNAAVAELQPFGSGLTTGLIPFLIAFSDSGSGRSLQNSAVPIDGVMGNGMRPYHWPVPKLLDPNSSFTTTIQNLSATARNCRITYHGYKVFGDIPTYMAIAKGAGPNL